MHNTGGRAASWEQISNSESYIYAQNTAAYKEPIGILWNLTRIAADEKPNRWSTIWRALDMGRGIIHNAEKTQAVFFSKEAIKVIETIPNTMRKRDVLRKKRERGDYSGS